MMKKFRIYLLVGGMPQSVSEYIKKKEFGVCDERKVYWIYMKTIAINLAMEMNLKYLQYMTIFLVYYLVVVKSFYFHLSHKILDMMIYLMQLIS